VDVDAFVTVHRPEWNRLEQLARKRSLSGAEADEFVVAYQRAATHLSVLRSRPSDPALTAELSALVARSRAVITGGARPWARELAHFATRSFPAAVWRSRWWSLFSAAFTLVIATAAAVWVANDPEARAVLGDDARLRQLVETDFASYYEQDAAGTFAAQVWTNNAWVAALAVALGITGVAVLWVLFQNAVNVGVSAGVMAAYDRLDVFFGLILPHGLLELTAVFVAAGAGLHLFWAWIAPGARPRSRALAEEGRAMITVALGLVVVLLVSGIVEGFVTPSGLPTWARIGIGVTVWTIFLGYVTVLGRAAVRDGETGDLSGDLAPDVVPTAA
jgi:uncharacterized membrane protein SpoIIM required for sporulation